MAKEKPFYLLKTKNELLLAEERKQLELEPSVKRELDKPEFKINSLVGARVTKDSPGKVVGVKLVNSAEAFLELTF